jgi:hypothetical protein
MKHTTFFYLVATAFVLVGATACSSGDDGDEPANPTPTNPTERKLVIGVSANPWLDENGNARETRGTVVTTETLEKFTMLWNDNEYAVEKKNGSWIPTPKNNQYGAWPAVSNDTPISFYAHNAPTNLQDNTTHPYYYSGDDHYISFSIEEASANQSDLLLSRVTNVTYSETHGVIWFTFDHACAAVEFNIQITNKLRTQLGTDLTVNSVVLKNIANTGDCHYSTSPGNHIGRWENVSGNANYTLTQAYMKVDTSPVALPCKTLFIIPQTLGESAGLEISYTFSTQTNTTAWIPLKGTEWEAGHLYPINIVLGTTLIK